MAQRTCGEHHEATPAKQLNCFVRSIALIERVGNALGTLAFTWATVVLLGGYPTVLRPMDDFWFATTIVFLEAARMFSRNNRLDYQVFFYTRGAVRPVGWNGLLVVVCLSNVLEEPLTEQALLPVLAMTIIYNLAGYDQDNCLEISRASELIPKIIGFTSYCRSNTTYADAGSNVLVKSSLKLLNRLTSIDGEIGTTLRHNISRHPFLLGNLAEILRDSTSSPELRKLGAGILRNLAVDVNTRQEIGRIQVVINGLMQTFLMPDGLSTSTNADPLLRKVAGQALAMLAMDSIDNCLAMLREKRFAFIKELTAIIHLDRYRCVSASLLRSMCLHARHELQLSDLKELSYALREVLEKVLVANRAEIGFLVGLSSEICKTVPDDFARELGHGQIKQTFVKCLVDALNENMEVSDACPEISRSILEQTITMMEYDSGYASYFNHHHMSKALSMMEQMACCSANYNIFVGDARLTEAKEPLSSLVARAKQLMAFR
ncbi:hypothetical protein QOZ80_3AG0224530 [Eleusine coracana subsp. coracana]|nr:hypothetical protein QOZ80_3AG0224530 [Eleusine coracana subsp. coracana]